MMISSSSCRIVHFLLLAMKSQRKGFARVYTTLRPTVGRSYIGNFSTTRKYIAAAFSGDLRFRRGRTLARKPPELSSLYDFTVTRLTAAPMRRVLVWSLVCRSARLASAAGDYTVALKSQPHPPLPAHRIVNKWCRDRGQRDEISSVKFERPEKRLSVFPNIQRVGRHFVKNSAVFEAACDIGGISENDLLMLEWVLLWATVYIAGTDELDWVYARSWCCECQVCGARLKRKSTVKRLNNFSNVEETNSPVCAVY